MVEYVCKVEKGARDARPARLVSVPGTFLSPFAILVSLAVNSLLRLARCRLLPGPWPLALGPVFPLLAPRTSFLAP